MSAVGALMGKGLLGPRLRSAARGRPPGHYARTPLRDGRGRPPWLSARSGCSRSRDLQAASHRAPASSVAALPTSSCGSPVVASVTEEKKKKKKTVTTGPRMGVEPGRSRRDRRGMPQIRQLADRGDRSTPPRATRGEHDQYDECPYDRSNHEEGCTDSNDLAEHARKARGDRDCKDRHGVVDAREYAPGDGRRCRCAGSRCTATISATTVSQASPEDRHHGECQ